VSESAASTPVVIGMRGGYAGVGASLRSMRSRRMFRHQKTP